jgi:hypothetical protein
VPTDHEHAGEAPAGRRRGGTRRISVDGEDHAAWCGGPLDEFMGACNFGKRNTIADRHVKGPARLSEATLHDAGQSVQLGGEEFLRFGSGGRQVGGR